MKTSFKSDSLFLTIIPLGLRHEGFYSKNRGWFYHPNDSGKRTLAGITQARFAQFKGISSGSVTRSMMEEMTDDDILGIYYKYYYKPIGIEQLKDHRLAAVCLDFAINFGTGYGIRLAQRGFNECVRKKIYDGPKLKVDNKLGPKTLKAFNSAAGDYLLPMHSIYEALDRYMLITQRNKKLVSFIAGWVNRSEDNIDFVLGFNWVPQESKRNTQGYLSTADLKKIGLGEFVR